MSEDERRPVPADQPPHSAHRPAVLPASLVAMRADWIDFYDTEYHQVVRFMMRIGASLDEARDATQHAFAESWALLTDRPDDWAKVTNRRTWIRTVARRRHLRPPGARRRPPIADGVPVPDQPHPGPEPGELTAQTQLVLQALRTLDKEAGLVMAMHLDGIETRDIAAELPLTEQRVRDVLKKARAKLKRELAAAATHDGR